jgi:2-phosphoglycolate phosphatase
MGARKPVRSILFDLDGTLLDTAPDLAFALNAVAQEEGLKPLPVHALKPLISGGAAAMVRFAFGGRPDDAEFTRVLQRMLAIYREHIADQTRFFSGMEAVIDEIERRQLPWGIVTNKLGWLTDPLLRALELDHRPGCVISGDTTQYRKPHPQPMLEACRRLDRQPGDCVYVGDALRDVEAGRQAGMSTLVALYGYLADTDQPRDWGATGLIAEPADLLRWLDDEPQSGRFSVV